MKMKAINFSLIVISVVISFLRCTENGVEKAGPIPPDSDSLDLPLSVDQLAFLETLSDTVIQLENILFENGQDARTFLETNDPGFLNTYPSGRSGRTQASTAYTQKLLFLARMYAMGNYLVDDDNHTYPAAGTDSPEQAGLAYSWGSKDYNIRQVPPVASGCMDKKIYGLDCTGMIWAMTQAANLTVAPKESFYVRYINSAQRWTDAFKVSADYKDLEMKDMGQLAQSRMKNGDIIFWNSHVGVYLYGTIYQSNGNSDAPGCNNNLLPSRGPRAIPLTQVLAYALGSYKVFRIVHEHIFTLKIENKHKESCGFDGLTYYDAVEMDVHVRDQDVTISNIINQAPTITPSTKSVFTCTLTCLPGSTGELNVIRGSGEVSQAPNPNGDYSFTVNLADSAAGAGFLSTMQCPDEDPIIGNGQPYDYTSSWHFILADSIQTQNPSSNYGVFIRLAPK